MSFSILAATSRTELFGAYYGVVLLNALVHVVRILP